MFKVFLPRMHRFLFQWETIILFDGRVFPLCYLHTISCSGWDTQETQGGLSVVRKGGLRGAAKIRSLFILVFYWSNHFMLHGGACDGARLSLPESVITLSQSEASIMVTWSLLANQRPVSRSHDHSRPIRGWGSPILSCAKYSYLSDEGEKLNTFNLI